MHHGRREVISWWMYDWANSAFILTVVAGFFPVFFKRFWCDAVDPTLSTARLGFGNAIAGLVVAVLSPLLGAVADVGKAKKSLLALFMLLGALSTIGLFFLPGGEWFGALAVFLIASVGFNSANIFYDALLVDVTDRERMDWVSSVGYGIGYLGCGLLFACNVLMVNLPARFGLSGQAQAVRVSFVMAGVWWLLFSLPLLLFVHERGSAVSRNLLKIVRESLARVSRTMAAIVHHRPLLLFLLAYWFYIDGVHTFVLMAVDFGMAIGIKVPSLMIALLVVQFVGFPCTLFFGLMAKRFGPSTMIIVGIIIYVVVCGAGALLLRSAVDYIILAGVTGVAQGGIQALSRSYFGKLIPAEASGEYFGFYNIVSRFAVIIGPAIVGIIVMVTKKAGMPSMLASRIGMSSVSLLFLAGAVLLMLAERLRKQESV
ncbi:MAG: MFS transporter [Chitinispirillaceae bacterium]|nr:MFS transporter [Chitinispirillaceae bacterium]